MCDEARLQHLLSEWEERFARGEDVTATALCPDCPQTPVLEARIAQLKKWRGSTTIGPSDEAFTAPSAPLSDEPLPAQEVFAGTRFEPLRHHASGGLGDVLEAVDKEFGRRVALKRIRPRHGRRPEGRERFRLEAEITGHLEHPGIVPVYGRGEDSSGQPLYAMRFIRGQSLQEAADALHAPGPASPDSPRPTLRQLVTRLVAVCNAVAYAHSRGVIHRDIKPSNIMLGRYGETLVVDWGLAQRVRREAPYRDPTESSVPLSSGSNFEARPGGLEGTVAFMGPEQAHGDVAQVGPPSDLFSLGATLFYLLTGRPPYQGGWALLASQRCDFPPPELLRPDVPPALAAICAKAMAKRPRDRYATALDLARDLEQWLADEPVRAYREPPTVRFARWCRRHQQLSGAAVAAVLVGALAVCGGLLRELQHRDQQAVLVHDKETWHKQAEKAESEKEQEYAEFRKVITSVMGDTHPASATLTPDVLEYLHKELAELESRIRAGRKPNLDQATHCRVIAARLAREGRGADAERAYRLAVRLADLLPQGATARKEQIRCRYQLGRLLADRGRLADAAEVLQQALHVGAPGPEHATMSDPSPELARVEALLGELLSQLHRLEESERHLRSALKRFAATLDRSNNLAIDDPGNKEVRRQIARVRFQLGIVLTRMGRWSAALAAFAQALRDPG